MSEFITSVKAILYDRVASPLFGIFSIAWVLCNYKIFVILFSDSDAVSKLIYIDYVLYGDRSKWLFWFVYPVIATLLAVVVYPLVAEPVYRHLLTKKASLSKIRSEIDLEFMPQQIRDLTEVLEKQRAYSSRQLQLRDEDIQRMSALLEKVLKEQSELQHEPVDESVNEPVDDTGDALVQPPPTYRYSRGSALPIDLLSKTQIGLLLKISSTTPMPVDDADKMSVRERYDLDVLLRLNLVETNSHYSNGYSIAVYALSATGRAYIVENGLDSF